MFGFRRRTAQSLDYIERLLSQTRREQGHSNQLLRIIMGNQEIFDSYAAQIAEQNSQIKAAVAVIVSEINKLQAAAAAATAAPLDTSKMDAALSQLTAAVDEVEAIPSPAVEEPAVEEPVEVEEVAVEDEEPADYEDESTEEE